MLLILSNSAISQNVIINDSTTIIKNNIVVLIEKDLQNKTDSIFYLLELNKESLSYRQLYEEENIKNSAYKKNILVKESTINNLTVKNNNKNKIIFFSILYQAALTILIFK